MRRELVGLDVPLELEAARRCSTLPSAIRSGALVE
jgi:hypothetical protein